MASDAPLRMKLPKKKGTLPLVDPGAYCSYDGCDTQDMAQSGKYVVIWEILGCSFELN